MFIKNVRSFPGNFLLFLILIFTLLESKPIRSVHAVTLPVTNSNDNGNGSLRYAIANAAPGDTITFRSSLSGATIPLASTLTLSKNVTIDGSGLASQITISGDTDGDNTGDIQVFSIGSSVTASLKGLKITKGNSANGAVLNSGNLIITDVTFESNYSTMYGASISTFGPSLTVVSSTFTAGIASTWGGAIFASGALTVSDSTFANNMAPDDGGAIYFDDSTKTLAVTQSTFSGNQALMGGGIAIVNASSAMVTDSTFSGNVSGGEGAGIFNGGNILTVEGSTFTGNHSYGAGGGISNFSYLVIANSTFLGNISQPNRGPAIYNVNTVWMTNVTLANNINGAFFNEETTYGAAHVLNTIMANSVNGPDCNGGPFSTNDNNLIETRGGCSAPALIADPKLATALAHNGGPTETLALLAGSPAIGAGSNTVCVAAVGQPNYGAGGIDQRGVMRPQGSHCDIGAYEDNGFLPFTPSPTWTLTPTATQTFTFTPTNTATATSTATQTPTLTPTASPTASSTPTPVVNHDRDTTGVFRPGNGALYLKNTNVTGIADVQINYGVGGDYPVVGDWDGNGTVTIGIYRNGSFYLRNSNTKGVADLVFAFGAPGDQPIAGDWNHDGVDTIGVYHSATGTFYLRNSNSAGAAEMSFVLGNPGDVGIAGDWNGDGFDTTGVFRPNNGALYLKNTNARGFADIQINYGIPGDQPVTGDWNNDGIDTIGVYRNGTFFLRNSNTIGIADLVFALGNPGDMPIAGNWDGLP